MHKLYQKTVALLLARGRSSTGNSTIVETENVTQESNSRGYAMRRSVFTSKPT
jgi:hypothetical protein